MTERARCVHGESSIDHELAFPQTPAWALQLGHPDCHACDVQTVTTSPAPKHAILQLDDMLWRPKRGASTSVEEFIQARSHFLEVHADSRWNPWVLDDRAADLDDAMHVMEQWTRAEPNFRRLTAKQLDARLARVDRECRDDHAAADRRRERNSHRYDAERESARLALLEHRARLEHDRAEVAAFRDGSRCPAMPAARRLEQITDLDTTIARTRSEVERLMTIVGDAEDVVDQRGWLPCDRRALMLTLFSAGRCVEVRELRSRVADLTASLASAKDRREREQHRGSLQAATGRLDTLLTIPPLTADDMCSECPTPVAQHDWSAPPREGPCPAWPSWAARLRTAREMIDSFLRTTAPPDRPRPPSPKPLAVVPAGLAISEVLARLMEIQAEHPDAVVRRGRDNKWEIWAPNEAESD
jgi:hypothetical protein